MVYNVGRNDLGVDVVVELTREDGEPVDARFGGFGGGCSDLVVKIVGVAKGSAVAVRVAGCSVVVVENPENHGAAGFLNTAAVGLCVTLRTHLDECGAGTLQMAVDYASWDILYGLLPTLLSSACNSDC